MHEATKDRAVMAAAGMHCLPVLGAAVVCYRESVQVTLQLTFEITFDTFEQRLERTHSEV